MEIKNGEYIFLKDTLLFKKHILESISFSKSVSLNKTQIIKQKIVNSDSPDFYFALWTNSESNLKIAKWLEKKGNKLFFVNNSSDKYEDFKKHYLLCVGNSDCFPELIATDSSKVWSCSKELKCLTTSIDSIQVSSCRTYKTVILDE
ncbi:hypothetical protein [Flavobacterium sp.]|uniref:hypothetical protein n=1 Tax=Flavobacterium sp. TaxID=239 RepID=UPI002D800FAE|nr:hypothetical protein [Flavobacterium sp.]